MAVVEAANIRHLPNQEPTLKSYGLHKLCKWLDHNCGCPRGQRHSCIDNAYVSLDATVSLRVLEDAITDHYPLFIKLETALVVKRKLTSIWRRDISKIKVLDFEAALAMEDWSKIYELYDPNIILDIILANINSSLNKIAPLKEIKFRKDKPRLNLKRDTLAAMDARNRA